MWSRATKIKVLVGILAAVVLVMGLAIFLLSRVEGVRDEARQVTHVLRAAVEAARVDPEEARKELQAEFEKIKAAGEPTSLQELIPPEVPDEENAALLYQQAFEKIELSEEDKDVLSDLIGSMAQPPRGEAPSMEAVEQIVAKNAAAIALLENAAQRPKCRFPVDWEAGNAMTFPHYGKLRQCARVLPAQVIVQVRRGDAAGALRTVEVGLAMCEAVRDEPLLISQLLRYALVQILLRPLHVVLEEDVVPTASCRELFDYLKEMEFMQSFVHSLWGERAMGIWVFDHVREKPEIMADVSGTDDPGLARIYAGPFGPPILNKDEATYLRLMSEQIAAGAKPYREAYAELAEIEGRIEDEVRPACVLTAILLPVFTRVAAKRDVIIARVGLAQVALGLKAYKNEKGEYPESLAQLPEVIEWAELPEDPFSGEDFIYQREGEGFLVYSIGPDLEDDGGKAEEDWEEGDIVWRCMK